MINHIIVPFKDQDRLLEEGLLKTEGGKYVKMSRYGVVVSYRWTKFVPLSKQDRLNEGLIKTVSNTNYISLDDIERINACFVATAV